LISISFIIFYLLLLFSVTFVYKLFRPNNKELLRKIIHIGVGPLIPLAKFLEINQNLAQYIAALVFILVLINYVYRLFPIIEDIDRKSFGTLFYCLSLFILISFFWEKDPSSLFAGVFIMTFGDGLAGLLGKNFKSKSWIILNQKKSLIGTVTMFLVSLIITGSLAYYGNHEISFFLPLIALLATTIEQFSIAGIDNLFVPIVSAFAFNLLFT
tara:strand:+ start:87 stop:725 length:639 start_codon:yes stop_codon:yes gene_type:complete